MAPFDRLYESSTRHYVWTCNCSCTACNCLTFTPAPYQLWSNVWPVARGRQPVGVLRPDQRKEWRWFHAHRPPPAAPAPTGRHCTAPAHRPLLRHEAPLDRRKRKRRRRLHALRATPLRPMA